MVHLGSTGIRIYFIMKKAACYPWLDLVVLLGSTFVFPAANNCTLLLVECVLCPVFHCSKFILTFNLL